MKKIQWAPIVISTILAAGFSFLGFLGKIEYSKLSEIEKNGKEAHDAILVIQNSMVPRAEYEVRFKQIDTEIAGIKTRLAVIETIQNKNK